MILTTNTPYPSRKIQRICACTHKDPQRVLPTSDIFITFHLRNNKSNTPYPERPKITILTTNTPYPSRKIRRIRACTHQRPQRKQVQYAVSRKGNTPYSSYMGIKYSGRYQTWSLLKPQKSIFRGEKEQKRSCNAFQSIEDNV
ncbi:hypothetical protein Tco_1116957 [Tanacetum coccineum]